MMIVIGVVLLFIIACAVAPNFMRGLFVIALGLAGLALGLAGIVVIGSLVTAPTAAWIGGVAIITLPAVAVVWVIHHAISEDKAFLANGKKRASS